MSKRRDHAMRLNRKAGRVAIEKKRWHKPDPRLKPDIDLALDRLREKAERRKEWPLDQ